MLAGFALLATALAGAATSTIAAGTLTIPGTTITVPVSGDGGIDLSKLLPSGVTLPPGVTLPAGVTLPPGVTLPGATTTAGAAATTTQSTPATPVTPTTTAPSATNPATGLPLLQTPTATTAKAKDDRTGDRVATLLLIVAGSLLLAGVLAWALARLLAWEPEWWSSRRHEATEAAWRTSNGWADFRDWLRAPR